MVCPGLILHMVKLHMGHVHQQCWIVDRLLCMVVAVEVYTYSIGHSIDTVALHLCL